jgi:hypothetical protein
VGQDPDAAETLPVSLENIDRFISLLREKGITPGNGGRVMSLNPARTFFGRLDLSIPEWKSRVVLRTDYSDVEVTRFARPEGSTTFALSSNAWTFGTTKHTTAVQVFTQPTPGVFNEFVVAYMDRPQIARDYTRSPSVQASISAGGGLPEAILVAGPPPPAGGAGSDQLLLELGDNIVFMAGSHHTLSAGMHLELFRYHVLGVRGMFGLWRFPSLDALAHGEASRYTITKDFGSAHATVRGWKPAAYLSDEWRVSDRVTLTMGVRADALNLTNRPEYNAAVDSILHRRTSDYPEFRVQWSPRVGFSWEPFGDGLTRVRGGAGIFVGSPPLGWLLSPMRSNGSGIRTLLCVGANRVPKFVADPLQQPQTCANGRGFSVGPVALVDRNLKMAQSFRSSLALDRRIMWGVNATVEALYSRIQNDFAFSNENLVGPQGVDRHGRVLYGTIDSLGFAVPTLKDAGEFPEVIDLRNHSIGHSWSLTGQLERPFANRLELRGSYTRSRSVDLQSITSGSAVNPFDSWSTGRALSGRHDDSFAGISSFEIPHRVVLGATYTIPWRQSKTDISFYYVGESGTPFTFADSALDGRSDLNADGSGANDPIYVPINATDTSEIVFSSDAPVSQAVAFEEFINRTPCLRRQRGTIMQRNSCRGPWVNTSNLSLRQSIRATAQHDLMVQLEVFNLLNLLNPSWGLFRIPNKSILQHVGQTRGSPSSPIFRFNEVAARNSTQNLESGYQLQLSMRYSF